MKKSEITVSMPMSNFEEMLGWKDRLESLENNLKSCYDKPINGVCHFDVSKAVNVTKDLLPYSYKDCTIEPV